jgi:hypothetical protein
VIARFAGSLSWRTTAQLFVAVLASFPPGSYPRTGVVSLNAPVLPLPGQFQRILSRCLVDVSAPRAFEDSQIRTIATGFDVGQLRAALACRAEWPQYRNQRWFQTSVSFGHVMLLPVPWDQHPKPPPLRRLRRSDHGALHGQRLFNIAHIPRKLPAGSANLFDPFPLNPERRIAALEGAVFSCSSCELG